MSFPPYPEDSLPPPETGPFERNQSTRETEIKFGVTNFALSERSFRGAQDVTFVFNSTQAAYFRAFWLSTLSRGGRWFTTRWPLPSGWFSPTGIRKFITVPTWRHIGNGAWRVSAVTELIAVRDPTYVQFSSLTYALTSLDAIEPFMSMANLDRSATVEGIEPAFETLGGEIAVKLVSFSTFESLEPGFMFLEGEIRTVIFHAYVIPDEFIHSGFVFRSGVIRLALIVYPIDPEFIHSDMICLGGTLT